MKSLYYQLKAKLQNKKLPTPEDAVAYVHAASIRQLKQNPRNTPFQDIRYSRQSYTEESSFYEPVTIVTMKVDGRQFEFLTWIQEDGTVYGEW
tara:strand:+ start:148 stop:426 length:279 start_codon:yes stop_codon:yes gene_type:complete